ncbi:PAS domain S-box protein [Draconibacterium halophilum]|uniref:histidine kinase n=1 Tax=Draconibacterium halophilum TaxID=2706887 RepID=A0A6C0RAI9_9BACT|nr:PAS domain S-box protein [Draconibacterium halophilum]QIA07109.1 PAS domain S-box protein [Draconibacterium halophilum]
MTEKNLKGQPKINSFKIIVIDDDEGLNFLIRKRLKREDFQVDWAENGNEALSKTTGKENEVLLIDYKLPDMTGKELIEKITNKFRTTPHFITMTGFGDEKIAVEMMKLGARDYIIKEADFIDVFTEKIKRICNDIANEHRLKINERSYKDIFENIQDTYYESTLDGTILEVSPSVKILSKGQIVREDLIGQNILPLYKIPEKRNHFLDQLQQKGEISNYELELINKDGSIITASFSSKIVFDELGKPIKIVGSIRDVTNRKKAEKTLRKNEQDLQAAYQQLKANELQLKASNKQLQASEQELKNTIEQLRKNEQQLIANKERTEKYLNVAAEIILTLNTKGEITLLNDSGRELLEYKKGELPGKNWITTCIPEQSRKKVSYEFQKMISGDIANFSTVESEIISSSGAIKTMLWHNTILKDENDCIIGTLSSGEDISARKEAEKQLLNLNSQLSLAQNIAKLGYWSFNIKTQLPKWTDEVFRMFGIPKEKGEPEFIEQKNYIHPDDWSLYNHSVERLINEAVSYDIQVRVVHNNGNTIWIRTKGFSVKNNKGEVTDLYGIVQDITDYKITEKQLIEQKLLFETMFNAIEDGVVLTDPSRKITHANNGIEKTFGYNPKKVIGKSTKIFYADEDKYKDSGSELFGENSISDTNFFTTYYRDKQNKVFPGESFGAKLKNANGDWIGNLGIMRNISERVKYIEDIKKAKALAERNEQDFRLLFENMHQGFALHKMIYNKNEEPIGFKFVKVSPAYEKITKRNISKLIGQNVYTALPETDPKWISLFNDIAQTGKNKQFEYHDKEIDKYYLISAFQPKPKFFAVLLTDITSLKKYEKELISAKEKAVEADHLKSAFLANMSHEIRTPMNGILGFTNLLLEPELSGKQRQEFIEIIQKSGDRMLTTVNDLIDISRIETGQVKLSVEEFNIGKELESHFQFFQPEAEKKGIKLILTSLLPDNNRINNDLQKFNSILTNLIKNAIKFTNTGFIEIGCIKKDEYIECYVKDSGIGIPENRQEAIFDRFVQADITDSRAFEGSGLGLAISKAYAEMMGGKLWVESEKGVGSTFCFTIPFQNSENKKSNNSIKDSIKPAPLLNKKLKILIAEDDEVSFQHLSILLKAIAGEIIHAQTGIEAVDLCRENPDINLILMDIKMPLLNGYEATQRIREFNTDVIIIAQTAFAMVGDRAATIKAGCNDYVTKPIKKDRLFEKIKILLNPEQ